MIINKKIYLHTVINNDEVNHNHRMNFPIKTNLSSISNDYEIK